MRATPTVLSRDVLQADYMTGEYPGSIGVETVRYDASGATSSDTLRRVDVIPVRERWLGYVPHTRASKEGL